MMKKISPEIKTGVIAILTIAAFIWLYSFLKGHNLFSRTDSYTVIYENIAGLEGSSPVEINGFKAGVVNSVRLLNDGSGKIAVDFSILKGLRIPEGSVAEITTATLIAGMKIRMVMAKDSPGFYQRGDTIPGRVAVSILDKAEQQFEPVMMKVDSLLYHLSVAMERINSIMTEEFASDLAETNSNIASATGSLEVMLAETEESFPSLIEGIDRFTAMINNNSNNIEGTITNMKSISDTIAAADIYGAVINLRNNLDQTNSLLAKINSGEGSAGMVLNDDSLYLNLSESLESLNLLLTDLRENPGNYVHFSLFGRKTDK
jgi:phospholipid/cholesterol/gamma-HCH transport system substrate-binding protein